MEWKNGKLQRRWSGSARQKKKKKKKNWYGQSKYQLRDPIIYRVRHVHHHQTGLINGALSDVMISMFVGCPLKEVTHILSVTLSFKINRPLYVGCLDTSWRRLNPQQIEFARLN